MHAATENHGPGIELLEKIRSRCGLTFATGYEPVSPGVADVTGEAWVLERGVLVRDPDGHAMLLFEPGSPASSQQEP